MGATKTIPYGTLIDTIRIVKQIGSGGSANVYVGEDESNGEFYAVKSISHNKDDIKLKRATRLEAGLHARVRDHPHIIELERIIRSESSDWTHLIMEYGAQGDLYSAITEKDLYCGDHALIRNVFLQLIDAVIHCHENGVFHRDLKPDNIMVFDGGKTVKLADFGLATTDTSSRDYGCGSTIYFSPECQGGLTYNRQPKPYATAPNDVWALGVILINLTTGRNPWKQACLEDENFRAFLFDPNFLHNLLLISSELNSILKRIFCIDPAQRITLYELRERIVNCKYFTRTAQVDQWEQTYLYAKKKKAHKKSPQPETNLPPSPPATPCSDRSRSTSPFIWQQRITPPIPPLTPSTEKENILSKEISNSYLTNMLEKLVV